MINCMRIRNILKFVVFVQIVVIRIQNLITLVWVLLKMRDKPTNINLV